MNQIKIRNHFWGLLFIDGILLIAAFFIAYYAKRGHVNIEPNFLKFYILYFPCWLLSCLPTNKYRNLENARHLQRLKPYFVSMLIFVGTMSLGLYALKWYDLSRLIVFGSAAIWFLLEVLFISGIYLPRDKAREGMLKSLFPFFFFLFELLLIVGCFYFAHFFKKGSFQLTEEYEILLGVICLSWLLIGLVIHKFRLQRTRNYLKAIWPFIKSMFLILGVVSFFIFGFRIVEFPRLMIFGFLTVFSFFEILIVSIHYLYSHPKEIDEPDYHLFKAAMLHEQETMDRLLSKNEAEANKYKIPGSIQNMTLFRNKLENIYLRNMPEVFRFIDSALDLESVDILNSEVINSGNPYNVETLPDDSLNLFINLHELNDFRRVNHYLIEVNRVVKTNGVYISKFEPKEKRRAHFINKYPFYLANILYFLDFIWKRCFPKLPFLQKIYFAATKGRDRVLSMAEGLGRLYFCGFEIIAMDEIDNFIYFAVTKTKEPSNDPNPSYSPVFKMKRIGRYGHPIYVYKFRTMYPYSEYLQGFLTDKFGYGNKGKIKEDFRVTTWGKFLRRFWLDELPQLINLVKGDLALVAVRPVSEKFLANYPDDLKNERLKYKPGCFPPYVAYRMQAVDEYLESERIYLTEKKKHPIMTDVKVLFLGIYNILTNKIRSE